LNQLQKIRGLIKKLEKNKEQVNFYCYYISFEKTDNKNIKEKEKKEKKIEKDNFLSNIINKNIIKKYWSKIERPINNDINLS
jgi:hypothetical protein